MGALTNIIMAVAGKLCGTQDPIHISAAIGVLTACILSAYLVIAKGQQFDAYGFLIGIAAVCGGVGAGVGVRDRLAMPKPPERV